MAYNGKHKTKSNLFWREFQRQSGRKSVWIDRKTETHTRLIAIMFFIGVAIIIIFGKKTLISWIAISKIFAAIVVITSFIPPKYYPIVYRIRKELKILFTICALTPILTALVLLTNFLIVSDIKVESYNIVKIKTYSNDDIYNVYLENDVYKEFNQIRSFSSYDFDFRPDSAHYKTAKGVFGLKVVRKAYLTP